jgi:DNA modification methylase
LAVSGFINLLNGDNEMNTNTLINADCLEYMRTMADNSVDLIFADPPYNLSSEVYIDKLTGKPDLKKANDFMNKWAGLDSKFLEEFYKQAYRILKHGGHCLLFGIDRQLFMFEYYANLSGFTQKQSLYWYFISNFPKASDLSKNLDKYFGAEREVVGKEIRPEGRAFAEGQSGFAKGEINITTPSTPLAKKYEGIKYSVAPLKQTNETIMVFQKPYKTGSCLHDVLAMENGDNTITCGGVDIENNRVLVNKNLERRYDLEERNLDPSYQIDSTTHSSNYIFQKGYKSNYGQSAIKRMDDGRFPAQTYISSEASEIIDLQSGVLKSGDKKTTHNNSFSINQYQSGLNATAIPKMTQIKDYMGDSGGASRILHKCDFSQEDVEYDLYHYCPKVSKSERNEGLEGFELKVRVRQGLAGEKKDTVSTNPHPTVKPKALLSKILKLFKTPNKQVLLDPFMGSGSMGISAVETGFNYIGIELDTEYFNIAKTRVEKAYYSNNIEIKNDIINLSDYRPSGESQLRFFN